MIEKTNSLHSAIRTGTTSSAAHRRLFNPTWLLPTLFQQSIRIDLDDEPVADELAQPCTDEDTDDDVAVVVHGEQHDDVGGTESTGVDKSTDELLERGGTEGQGSAVGAMGRGGCTTVELSIQGRIVLLAQAAEEFDGHDEEDDADAGASEHALGPDVPLLRDEAGVDGVPIPQHRNLARGAATARATAVIHIHRGVC